MNLKAIALILALAVVGALAGLYAGQKLMQPKVPPLPAGTVVLEEGARRTDARLEGIDGDYSQLSDFDGRPLLINFWATWCKPCIEELPLLDTLHVSGSEVQVIGIALDDRQAVQEFLAEHPVGFPIFLAEIGRVDLSTTLGNARSVLPYSVLIGADGRIQSKKFGAFDAASLAAFIEPLQAAPAP